MRKLSMALIALGIIGCVLRAVKVAPNIFTVSAYAVPFLVGLILFSLSPRGDDIEDETEPEVTPRATRITVEFASDDETLVYEGADAENMWEQLESSTDAANDYWRCKEKRGRTV